jgi:methyl-accepting chemotaxis protein
MERGKERASESVQHAQATSAALLAIDDAVANISDMNAQIASASEQQSAVAEEINRSLSAIRDVSVETAQGAEQVTTASEELARMASGLQASSSVFSV